MAGSKADTQEDKLVDSKTCPSKRLGKHIVDSEHTLYTIG